MRESDPQKKLKKTPKSPEGGKNEELSPSPRQHPTFHTIASSIPTHCKTKTEEPSTTTSVMPELPASMMSKLAQILAVQCPLPGQPGAPVFNGKDIGIFLRNWERFTGKYCFSDERKIADLPDYCDAGIATYVDTLTKVAKAEVSTALATTDEDLGTTGGPIGGSEEVDSVALWGALRKVLLIKFRKDNSEQHRLAVPFLLALVKDKAFRTDAEDVERYIHQYKEILNTLLRDGMLTRFDQMVLFWQGLLESMAGKIYTMAKLDVDDPSSFVKSGRFKEALEMALTIIRTSIGIDRLRTLGIDQSELPVEGVNQILVRDKTQMNPAHVPTSALGKEIPPEAPSWEDRCKGTSEESGTIGGRKEKELVDDDLTTGKHPTI